MMLLDDLQKIIKKYVDEEEVTYYGKLRLPGIRETVLEPKYVLFFNTFNAQSLDILVPGGEVIVIFPNIAWFEKHPEDKDWEETNGELKLIAWKYGDGNLWIRYVIPGKYEYEEEIKPMGKDDIVRMLADAELEKVKVFSDIGNEEYSDNYPWLLGLAVKPIPPSSEEEIVEAPVTVEKINTHEVVKKKIVAKSLKLHWRDSNNKPQEIEIQENIVIGRGRGDVITMFVGEGRYPTPMMLFDPNKHVSRRHIEIVRREDGWYLRDLGSTNGTMLNGVHLKGWRKPQEDKKFPSDYVKLEDEDEIILADSISFTVDLKENEAPSMEVKAKSEATTPEKTGVLVLQWVDGNLMRQQHEIEETVYVGRNSKDILTIVTTEGKIIPMGIVDTEGEVAKKHFEIFKIKDSWLIRDLGSKTGTYLNGKKLEGWEEGAMSKPVEIKDGDEILFGKYMITVSFK